MTETTITLPVAGKIALIPGIVLQRLFAGLLSAGRGLEMMGSTYAQAVATAYCPSFQERAKRPPVFTDEDLEGRDPNW
jgi:hypothetical protein